MKRVIALIAFLAAFILALSVKALAVCPLCAIAVGAGVGVSRWLGIDDSITGLWVGGLIVALIMWTGEWLAKKHIDYFGRTLSVIIGYYLISIIPLYFMGVMGRPLTGISLFGIGIDKLTIGIIVGSLGFWFGAVWYDDIKLRHNNHAYFPFQKVVMPISPLLLMTALFYFLTK